jgi:hypothetical protein
MKNNDKVKYFTRYVLHEDGSIKEVKVSSLEAKKNIEKMLERDKEMLDILKKL